MRFLLDTNILIPLEDSSLPLSKDLADFVRIAQGNGHVLLFHKASRLDIGRDKNLKRRAQTLERLRQYIEIGNTPECPWNQNITNCNDQVDNEILYSIWLESADYLITEDIVIHTKSQKYKLKNRVLAIQEAASFLRTLHERESVRLPNIEDVPLYSLVPELHTSFFKSLLSDYPEFFEWFRAKAREGRQAWIVRENNSELAGICIYTLQNSIPLNNHTIRTNVPALKLCTFKVGEQSRGNKIGELFLKTAFKYAWSNNIPSIFITARVAKHLRLIEMLVDFGFEAVGSYKNDEVFIKQMPKVPPAISDLIDKSEPFEYSRRYFPQFIDSTLVNKFIVPIKPIFHKILFPDFLAEKGHYPLFQYLQNNPAGNAIKQAYICHSRIKKISPGDILLLYRSEDLSAITTIGIAESISTEHNPESIAKIVKRRTAYGMDEIRNLAFHGPVKVILFRSLTHLSTPIRLEKLIQDNVILRAPQSIMQIKHVRYESTIADRIKRSLGLPYRG